MTVRWTAWLVVFILVFPSSVMAEKIAGFKGKIDFEKKQFDLRLDLSERSSLALEGGFNENDSYALNLKLNHIQTRNFDISTNIQVLVDFLIDQQTNSRNLRAQISSQHSLINYKPVHEMKGFVEYKSGSVMIRNFTWDQIKCSGWIELKSPFSFDLVFQSPEIDIRDLGLMLGCSGDNLKLEGLASGKVQLAGLLKDKIQITGRLVSRSEGFIDELQYDNFFIQFQGDYPKLKIVDSRVAQIDGLSFQLSGEFDLREGCEITKGLTHLRTSPLIDQDDLEQAWTIKQNQADGRSRKTEFKHRLRLPAQDDVLGEREGILGVEHKIEF